MFRSSKTVKVNKTGRLSSVVVLLIVLAVSIIAGQVAGTTIAYYSTKLSAGSQTARVAKWDVSVSLDESQIVMSSGYWSTPYKIEINNDSEVVASYGHEETEISSSSFSFLTFSDVPEKVSEIRIIDAETGSSSDISSYFQNHSVAIRFTGSLDPGEHRTYYIQFKSESSDIITANVKVNSDFRFEQAIRKENNFSVTGYTVSH